ncbi:glycosyltransferase family 2 protein [Clostridium sp. BL-8]|uniref:glycosyltransferase family 2 protein n=1 Tax=Clostridium sp. BL-8 TaxID=349938 RepID=UPI00098C8E5C|nr:glycosyltransferase family 2 protein [Clostridium sp. BL-8]OOM79953.1 putative glycosyltransferase EpsH [Clostridium sp. BL-8]
MAKISIIIPCYNIEKYLERCIDSLVNQTIGIKNLELIFIDDASTDSTFSILLDLEKKYPDSVMVVQSSVNLKHGGARNLGVQYASCEYISFVDADDWVDLDMYEKLYSKLEEYRYDVVSCRYIGEGARKGQGFVGNKDQKIIIKKNDFKDLKENWFLNFGEGGVWGRIYKKSIIDENNITFPEGVIYEDSYWGYVFRIYVQSIYIVEEQMYHYYGHLDSAIGTMDKFNFSDKLTVELMKLDKYKELGIMAVCYEEIELDFIRGFYYEVAKLLIIGCDPVPCEILVKITEILKKAFPNYKENSLLENYIIINNEFGKFVENLKANFNKDDWKEFAKTYANA